MNRTRWVFFAFQAATVAAFAAVAACGSRTGLLVPPPRDASLAEDAGADAHDAARRDAFHADVAKEAEADAPEDAPPDTFVFPDAPDECPDAGGTVVYVITSQNVLMSFYPPSATFKTICTIVCPDPDVTATPFSMAVDRRGIAYVVFTSGNLYRVSNRTAACIPTPFVPGNNGFPPQFGMGFSADTGDGGAPPGDGGVGETLYVAGDQGATIGTTPVVLGSIDTKTFQARTIGVVFPPIYASELTGTGGGELFGFYSSSPFNPGGGANTAAIGQLDKVTGQVLGMTSLPGVDIAGGWAFAFWGGDFYTFTAPGGTGTSTIVQRYRPSDGSLVQVATTPGLTVVGAGVSTCAPVM